MNVELKTLPKLFQALSFAAVQHQYQRRGGYGRLPYINHLIKVADVLIQIGQEKNETLLLASILHDIIEDTEVKATKITALFGQEVTDIVLELTDDMSLPYLKRKQLQVENAPKLSVLARKIRIADKGSNMQDLMTYPIDWPLEKKQAYVLNSIQVVDQIRGVNADLEKWFDQTSSQAKKHFNLEP